jgi:DNA-directed RNA polymerase subunit delta
MLSNERVEIEKGSVDLSLGQLSQTELREMSLIELAHHYLEEKKQAFSFAELLDDLANLLDLSKDELNSRMVQFYTDMNIDGRFLSLGDNRWGLREWYPFDQVDEEVTTTVKPKKKKAKAQDEDEEDLDLMDEDLDYDDLDDFEEEDLTEEEDDEDEEEDDDLDDFDDIDENDDESFDDELIGEDEYDLDDEDEEELEEELEEEDEEEEK